MPGRWTWTDAWIFIGVFLTIRIIIIWFVTRLYIAMIPEGDCCPLCDGYTLPIQRDGWWKVLGKRFRRSWCLDCGWEGVLRCSADYVPPVSSAAAPRRSSPSIS